MRKPTVNKPVAPPYNHQMEYRLQKGCTGEHIHRIQGFLASYQGWHALATMAPTPTNLQKLAEVEKEISQFLSKCMLQSLPSTLRQLQGESPELEV
jgi:hypothetical protein